MRGQEHAETTKRSQQGSHSSPIMTPSKPKEHRAAATTCCPMSYTTLVTLPIWLPEHPFPSLYLENSYTSFSAPSQMMPCSFSTLYIPWMPPHPPHGSPCGDWQDLCPTHSYIKSCQVKAGISLPAAQCLQSLPWAMHSDVWSCG